MKPASEEHCENCGHVGLQEFIHRPGHYLLRCPDCDLYQKGILESSEVYEDRYHNHYADRLPAKMNTARIRLQAAAGYLPDQPRMLDVGCSIGATVRAAAGLGWRASGVDISRAAVEFCCQDGLDCHAIGGCELPFADETFDLVTNWHVIEHVPDVRATLREWYRVLKPGGVLMIETPASNFRKVRQLGAAYKKFFPPDHLYTFNRRNLTGILEDEGYQMLPNRLIGSWTTLAPHLTAYAWLYRGYREFWRSLQRCKSFEVICRKPREHAGERARAA